MASLLYLKHAFYLSDEELVVRWSENVLWQFFSGMVHFEHRLPCPRELGVRVERGRLVGGTLLPGLRQSWIATAFGLAMTEERRLRDDDRARHCERSAAIHAILFHPTPVNSP